MHIMCGPKNGLCLYVEVIYITTQIRKFVLSNMDFNIDFSR